MAILTLVILLTSLVWPFISSFDRTGESAVDYDNPAVVGGGHDVVFGYGAHCLLYTSPSPRDDY